MRRLILVVGLLMLVPVASAQTGTPDFWFAFEEVPPEPAGDFFEVSLNATLLCKVMVPDPTLRYIVHLEVEDQSNPNLIINLPEDYVVEDPCFRLGAYTNPPPNEFTLLIGFDGSKITESGAQQVAITGVAMADGQSFYPDSGEWRAIFDFSYNRTAAEVLSGEEPQEAPQLMEETTPSISIPGLAVALLGIALFARRS